MSHLVVSQVCDQHQPEISLVVPIFNQLDCSKAMLASLLCTLPSGLGYEIILVDDASTDGTRQWLAALSLANLCVVLNDTNLGFARSVNAGVARATGKVLALLNSDLLLTPGWLEPMLAALHDSGLNAGVVGNLQTRVADGSLDHAGVHLSAKGKLDHIQTWPKGGMAHGRVFAVTGACCLVRRDVFESVGGFDEAFVNGAEDIDLCQKVKAKGLHIAVAYQSVVKHHVSQSRDRASQQNEINSRRLVGKWRKEFKRELAQVWLGLLPLGDQAWQDSAIEGQFTTDMLATPQVLARLVAENKLQQDECYWARTLDGVDVNADLAKRCQVRGLHFSPTQDAYVLDSRAELRVTGLGSSRNFYVCGRVLDVSGAVPIVLTLTVNGIQEKTIPLEPGANFNAGVIAPLCLPGVTNRFVLSTTASVVVSHFVLDDQVVGAAGNTQCT